MGIFLRTGAREVRQWTAEPPIAPFPGTDPTGRVNLSNNPDMALAVPAVWACVGLLANTVSSLPLQTFRKGGKVPERIPDPPLVLMPASKVSQSQWLHMVMVSLLLRGNAVGLIAARDGRMQPTQVELLNPDNVEIKQDDDTGVLSYTVIKTRKLLDPDDVWHLPGLCLPGSKIGLSPITYAAATIGVDIGSRKFASDFFAGGGVPKGILTSDQKVIQEEARGIKERFMAAYKNRDPVVLGQGLTYLPLSVRPEESQFLATQGANVAQVARYFWVPPEMIGGSGGNSLTYASVEQRSMDFLTFSVGHWLKRIEDGNSALLPSNQYVQFDTSVLLRTDAETAARISVQHIAAKVIAPSEEREKLGLPPMTAAQKIESDMVPLTVTPLGGAKALPAITQPPGPVAPVPATENPQGA